jgi:acetyl esterase/lipase
VVFRHIAVDRAVKYGSAPDGRGAPVALLLDLYRPRGDHRARRPAMVWVHGGGFAGGTRTHRTLRSLALGSARRGYVAVSVDYRILSPGGCDVMGAACRAAAIADQHDVQAAVRWLRANAARLRIDPARIAVGGTSVGGILSYLVGTRAEDPGDTGNPGFSSAVRGFVSIAGGFPGGGGYATPGDAPGLLFHGTADRVVPFSWSADAARALRDAGVPAILERIPRGQHVAYQVYRRRYDEHTAWFLYRRLGLAPRRS